MLVFSRKDGEGAVITTPSGERILITLSNVRGNRARIGIKAPKDHQIKRSELDGQWPLGLPGVDPTSPQNREGLKNAT